MRIKNLLFISVCLSECLATVNITDDGRSIVTVSASLPTDKDFLETKKNDIFKYDILTITTRINGGYNGQATSSYGALANAINSKTINYNNRRSLSFIIDSTGMTGSNGSIFFSSKGTSTITFDTDTVINFIANSNIGKGVFYSAPYQSRDPAGNDQTGKFIFKKSLRVDAENTNDGAGKASYIFNLDQAQAQAYVNYNDINGHKGESLSNANIIQLTGNLRLNGKNATLGINLTNKDSYILGKEDYISGNLNLGLKNGGKWIVTSGDVNINELMLTNNANPATNASLNSTQLTGSMSMIDIASQRIQNGFDQIHHIKINTLKSGDNGVFRTMIDLASGQGDLVTIQNQEMQNATQHMYMQILQKGGYKLTKDVAIKVAEIINGGENLSITSLPVNIGLYTYQPTLSKERQNSGYKWVIYEKVDENKNDEKKDADVQESLKHWLSLQYRIYRIQTDSINRHIDELVPTFTHNNFWANYFIGSQGRGDSRDDYQTFQFGYDWGMNARNLRHFAGGFFDYTKMKDYDRDYDGSVDSFGLAGYYQISTKINRHANLDIDAKMKYTYSANSFFGKNNLANANFTKSYHLFYMGARVGSKIDLDFKKEWFIEPSINAGVGFMNGGSINMIDTLTQENFGANQEMGIFLSTKINASVGKRFIDGKNYFDLRLKNYYAFDNNTGGDVTLIDVDPANRIFYQTAADHRWGIGLDANYGYGEGFKLYASIERTFFSNYNTIYLFYIGLRVSLDDLFSGALFRSDNASSRAAARQRENRGPKGRIIFGGNARPLPKVIEE